MAKPKQFSKKETENILKHIKENLIYDGKCFMEKNTRKSASYIHKRNGYRYMNIASRKHKLKLNYRHSRVVFLFHYGHWPKGQIDHINRDKLDDRIENLRDVSISENHLNGKPTGKIKEKYIYRDKKGHLFCKVRFNGEDLFIKSSRGIVRFNNLEEAIKKRNDWLKKNWPEQIKRL